MHEYIDRRNLLAGTALAIGAAPLLTTDPTRAGAPLAERQVPGLYRYKVGTFELTAAYDGVWYRPIDEKFIANADYAAVGRAMADAFMPPGKLTTPFTALLVNTGSKLILLDTGTAGQIASTAGTLGANLGAAGVDAEAIDVIVISHFHPDHINGIKDKDGRLVFPKAEIMVPEPEWKFWMEEANLRAAPDMLKGVFLNFRRIFGDLADQVTRYRPGLEVLGGITSIPAFGHTPGHTVFAVHSGNDSLLVLSDTTQHPALFARHPEWQPAFDVDPGEAVVTRRSLLDRVAAERLLVTGYHFPFPACGHIVKTAQGYEYVPALWQTTL
jgi:glyoxylase-like metal-dependent hydrolase (beta-lactamase superfamily II)